MSDEESLITTTTFRPEEEKEKENVSNKEYRIQKCLITLVLILFSIYIGLKIYETRTVQQHYILSTQTQQTIVSFNIPNYSRDETEKTILVTGINGLIGSHVVRELIFNYHAEQYTIYGLVRPHSDLYNLIGIQSVLKLLIGDITDPYRMIEIIKMIKCPLYLYHFAAQSINGISDHNSALTLETNVQGTHHLLQALIQENCQNKTIFIFASSSTVYGKQEENMVLDEQASFSPVSIYGSSKVMGEMLCVQYFNTYGLQHIRLRFFIQIGVGGTDSLSIQQFAKQIALIELKNEQANSFTSSSVIPQVLYHGNLDTSRDISDVGITARLVVALVEGIGRGDVVYYGNNVYNIGRGKSVTIKEALDSLLSLSTASIVLQPNPSLLRFYDEKTLLANNQYLLNDLEMTAFPEMNMTETLLHILNDWRSRIRIKNSY